jgi:HAD superfamily hydrolase (TIGR01549 family)
VILFDLGDTLIYFDGQWEEMLIQSNQALFQNLVEQGIQVEKTAFLTAFSQQMYRVSQNHWHLEKDTHEILAWLTMQGCRLGLITNASDTIDVNTLLTKYQLNQYFEKIVISASFGWRKPHPAIFNEAIQHFEYPLESYLMVGDKLANDILGAQNAGIHSAWIKRRGRTEFNQQHRHIHPDYQLETLLELKEIV